MTNENLSKGYRVLDVTFNSSVFDLRAAKEFDLPEVAFVGRSNVGKSSLLNALCGRRALARTSKTPGRTQSLNYFKVRYSVPKGSVPDDSSTPSAHYAHFVDLPGFGHAQVSKGLRKSWQEMIGRYLSERDQLCVVVLLVDCRRTPGDEESWIVEMGREGGLLVVLTKVDKLSKNELKKRRDAIAKKLDIDSSQLILSSGAPKKQKGIGELTQRIFEIVANSF